MERHQPPDTPSWSAMRREWISGILRGMAELNGENTDTDYLERLDQQLEQAKEYSAVDPAPFKLQKYIIQSLGEYVKTLELRDGDPRPQLMQVYDLLEDMISHLQWDNRLNGLYPLMDHLESSLPRLTALQPIRFTHLLMGGDREPNGSAFVFGSLTTVEQVMNTELFAELSRQNPQKSKWATICVTYCCGRSDIPLGVRDADEFDLKIMRMAGDRFLDLKGIHWTGTSELCCMSNPEAAMKGVPTLRILKVEPGEEPYEKEISNDLASIQAEVGGGLFQPVYIGGNVILCCNKEGKLNGMEPNRWLGDEEIIRGPFFLVGADDDGGFVSLTDKQIAACMDVFGEPQQFTGEEPELEPRMEFYTM